jgi:hypothetical protein
MPAPLLDPAYTLFDIQVLHLQSEYFGYPGACRDACFADQQERIFETIQHSDGFIFIRMRRSRTVISTEVSLGAWDWEAPSISASVSRVRPPSVS